MEPIRERIDDFIRRWRSRYEGNRVFRVLAVAVAVLLALLVLRRLRVLAAPVLIGAILVAGWLLVGPLMTLPRFSTDGPVVRDGVAVIVACGKKSGFEHMGAALKYAPESRTGTWGMSGEVSVQSGNTTHRIRTSVLRDTNVCRKSTDHA